MEKSPWFLAPQGFPVDSLVEFQVAFALHAADIPVFRKSLMIEGRRMIPSFVVPTTGAPLVIEVLMVAEGDKPKSHKEADYQARWLEQWRRYEAAGLQILTITPSECADTGALAIRLQAVCDVQGPHAEKVLETALTKLGVQRDSVA